MPDTTGIWLLSPRKVVEAFIHAHELPSSAWGVNRVVNLPGITVDGEGSGVTRFAGWPARRSPRAFNIKPDARIQAIVQTWPVRFRTPRAHALGFTADRDIETVIRDYVADERITRFA